MGNSVCGHTPNNISRSNSRKLSANFSAGREENVTAEVGHTISNGSSGNASGPTKGSSKERYIGAYGKLLDFLKECRSQEVISSARYLDLLAAVDDLGSTAGSSVSSSQKFFQGTEQYFAQVLPAMGIDIAKGGKGSADNSKGNGFFRCTSETDLTAILEERDFNCRSRNNGPEADVPLIIHGFIAHYDLIDRYSIEVAVLGAWIQAIGLQYTGANPYHNWMHAVDVYQFCHLSIFLGGGGDFFNFQDVLALLAASIAHDVRHPGVNNAHLVSTGSPIAITYNDKSVLENMHASVFFETLRSPGKNFLEKLPTSDFTTFRSKVIDAILATDMGIHFELVDKLTARMSKDKECPFITNTKGNKERQQASKTDRRMLLQIFMHMADLGHTCRPWDIHKDLVIDLEEEFFRQGDKERELGVPIMPMMDRSKDSAAAGQGFFLEKLVNPLLEPFCYFLSAELGGRFQENLSENKRRWGKLVEAHGKSKTARELLPLEQAGAWEADRHIAKDSRAQSKSKEEGTAKDAAVETAAAKPSSKK